MTFSVPQKSTSMLEAGSSSDEYGLEQVSKKNLVLVRDGPQRRVHVLELNLMVLSLGVWLESWIHDRGKSRFYTISESSSMIESIPMSVPSLSMVSHPALTRSFHSFMLT